MGSSFTYFDISQFPDSPYRTMIVGERFVSEWFVGNLSDCDLYYLDVGRVFGCVDYDYDPGTDDTLHLHHNYIERKFDNF